MDTNMYQWPTDVTKYRTTRTDTIAMELHRLGCNVCSKLREEQAQATSPHSSNAEAGGAASCPAHPTVHAFAPSRPPQCTHSTHSSQGFAPGAPPQTQPQPQPQPQPLAPPPAPAQFQQPSQPFGPLGALRVQADVANFYRMSQAPQTSPLPIRLPSLPSPTPTPPPPTPCSPLPPAGVLHCPTPQFAFAPPAPFQFRSMSPMRQQYQVAPEQQRQFQMATDQQRQFQTPPEQQRQLQMAQEQQRKFPMMPEQQPFMQFTQYKQPYDACPAEARRRRRHTHPKADQRGPRGDTPRHKSAPENPELLPGHLLWPTVSPSGAPGVRDKVKGKGSLKNMAVPARASEPRRQDAGRWRRRRARAAAKEPICVDSDSSSSEFFWNSPDEEVSQRAREEAKRKADAENRSKHMPVPSVARRCAHAGVHRSREMKPRADEVCRSVRRHATGDKRRHERSDSLERYVKLRRAECDGLYAPEPQPSPSHAHAHAHAEAADAKSSDVSKAVLKGRAGKHAGGNAKRHRERAEMGDSPSRRHARETEKKAHAHHGATKRSPKQPDDGARRHPKQPGAEGGPDQPQAQQSGTFIELVEESETPYFEDARETPIQVQMPDGWFNNLPTITEMKNEESPATCRHDEQTALTDSKRRVHVFEKHSKSKNLNVMEGENDLKTRKLSTNDDDLTVQENTAEISQFRNPPRTFSEVKNISPPLSWATGRNTEVYTAQVTTINKTDEKCVQSPSDSGNKIRNALLEKTWPQPLPIFLTPQNDTSTSPNSETALRTCANKDRLDKKPGEKDYERITIISIQHDKETALKNTKQLIQSTKDDIQQSIKLAASDIFQKKPNESTRKMVSKSTQRGRSPGAEYVLGKHSRALGAHGERSRSGARLRRVQITPIVRFRRAPPVSLQNIAKVSDIDCKNNKTSNDDSYKLIKKIPLECKEIVSKPSNVPTGFSTTSMSFMGNAKNSKTSHHSINASSMVECAGIQSLIQSESPSKMLRSIGSQTSNETERDLSTTSVQPSLSVENKKHSKDNSEKCVPSSVTATFSAHATSNMDLQAMKDSRISKKSSLGVFSTNQISSHPKGSTCNLSDISWQTINVNSVTNSQESSIHSQSEFQKSSNPTSKCSQTFNENLLSTHGEKKRPSTGTVLNKKLKNAFSQSINTFPLVDSQTINLPYEAGLRESCVISSYNSPKHSLHGSQGLKKQQSEVLASKSKHSVANYQNVNNSSGTNQENMNVLDVGLQNINETQNSESLRNMIIQNEIISQETEIKTFTLTAENENNVLIEKNVDATNQQIVENNLQISHEYHQESIADSHQETEVTQQRIESNNLDVQEAPSERVQNAQISPRRVRITLPPSSTLKGILKSHTNVPESQRKLSGSPRKSFMREPNFPSLRHIHHHSMTSSKDEDKFSSQKISLAEKHKHSKSFDIKTKDARVTIQEQPTPKRNFPKNKRNLSADKKKSNHSQVGASPSEKLPQKVNERTDQSFPITSDIKQSPNPVDADQNNQHSTTENGNAQATRKSLEIQTDNLSKSTQLSAQSLQSNSQAASLQRLVKELTAVAKDLHRTVVHDLRRLENLPANTTAPSEQKPIDSNKQNEVPNNTTVEHNESKEEKEIKCIFMSDGNATTNAPSPNALNGIEHKNKPPLDAVHIPQKEFVTETQICSNVQAAENKQPHTTLQNKFDNSRRTKDTETMRMKQHIVGNLKLKLPTFVDNKNKTRMTKITKPPRSVEEHTQKHLADRSRNQEHPGIVMKRVPKNELKDGEDLRKHHVVTMRDVHKSSASLSRRFQRRPVVLASHQRYNTREVKTHQEVKLKNKKDSHLKTQVIPDSRPEVEITNVLLHSEPNPRPNQENHLPYSQHVRSLEATARCIPKTPSAQFKQLSVCEKEHGGSTSLSHLQINKEGSNSQRPSATVTQINQQSTRLSQQLMTQKPSDSMLITPIISQNDTQKQTSELVCIKEPPKSGGKIQRKSSIFSKRIKNIVSNGLKRTRIPQAMRSKITSNVLNVSSEKDRKVLPRGTKSINQHSSSVPARRDRIQGPSVAQSRPQNSLQTSNQPKKSGAFTFRQQTELNVKTDKDSTNASSQKTEKYSSFPQNPKERVERGANRPTARVVRSGPIPNIPRQLLKRRGVVKKRRNINPSNTTRRMENPTNRLKLNPVELAEIAELETALEIPPLMYSQPPPDGATRNFRAPPLRPEAPRARKRFFNKRAANSSDSKTRHKSKPAATAAIKARGGKTTVAAAAANGVGKQPFSVIRRVKRPVKRRAKDHSEFVGVESSLSSRETMDSTTEISTVGQAVKPAEVPGENASDRAGREKRAFSKRTEGIVKRESKSSTRGSKSSWRSDSSGGSRRGSKRVTPCDSASSLPSRKPLLHKMRSALLGPLTCLKSHRQAQRSPPCEFLMRPIELSDKTSSKVLGIEGLNLNLV